MRSFTLASSVLVGLLVAACGGGKDDTSSVSNAAGTTSGSGTGNGDGGAGGAGGAGGSGGAPDQCTDGEKNGAETDVDCGGGTCQACELDLACDAATDCVSEECTSEVCTACADGENNGTETDIDCGGLCDPCDLEQNCEVPEDCVTGVCFTGTCINPGCGDAIMNGTETGIDCGGPVCVARCPGDEGCMDGFDCESTICVEPTEESPYPMVCTTPTCEDGVKNFGETDQDCGGDNCQACRGGQLCENPGDCQTNSCNQGQCECPEEMVTVPVLGGGAYCIDQGEVTYEKYEIFADANPQYDDPECAANGYTPSSLWPPKDLPAEEGEPNYIDKPVRFVDWCDARAYCRWAGKRLCGVIDPVEGELLPLASTNDPAESQWFNACSIQGTNTYPYGDDFAPLQCVESVGTPSASPDNLHDGSDFNDVCEGGVQSLHHMSGNVAEWEDSCDGVTGPGDLCSVRGGSYTSTDPAQVACNNAGGGNPVVFARNTSAADIGFRCCE